MKKGSGSINVKEFGAKGDGISDDTAAIQAALDAASQAVRIRQDTYDIPYPDGIPSRCGYHCHETGPEVFIPHGHYIVSATLFPHQALAIRGENHPWIEQKDNSKDIIYSDESIRQAFTDLAFHGGRSHLNLNNWNEDNGLVRIESCKFYGSSAAAIQMRETSQSTMLLVLRCQIVGCEQALITHTDFTHIREGWITGGTSGDGALIVCAGTGSEMTVSNLCCVPMVNGFKQRWIDNYGSLVCRNVRFGGEEGGVTPVYNFAKYKPVASGSRDPAVIIDGCVDICAWGNAKARCVVYCEEVPNLLVVRNCVMKGISPVKVSESIDPDMYFKAKSDMLRFCFEDNAGEFSNKIPAILKNPLISPPEGPKAISSKTAEKAMEAAMDDWKKRKSEPVQDAKLEFNGHCQQARGDNYIDFSPEHCKWDLDDLMDGTTEKCSLYYDMLPLPDGVLVMRKAEGGCAHVIIRDVKIDLNTFPWLTWNMIPSGTPANLSVIVEDKESGRNVSVELAKGEASGYRAYNLQSLLNSAGVHTFDIKLYYQGTRWPDGMRTNRLESKPGDYIIIPFVRAEKS